MHRLTLAKRKVRDILKQWLKQGKDRSTLGQMEIRKKIVEPTEVGVDN